MQLGQEKKSGMSDSLTPVHGKSHHVLQASHCIQVDPSSSSFPYTNPHIEHSHSLSVLLVLSNRDSFCRCFLRISTPLEALCLVLCVDLFVTFEALCSSFSFSLAISCQGLITCSIQLLIKASYLAVSLRPPLSSIGAMNPTNF